MDGEMNGWMNGWLNGWMNGWMNANDEDKAAAPTTSASQAYSIGSVGMIVSFHDHHLSPLMVCAGAE